MLSDEVKITVLEVKGKQVRLGIDAPADVPVHREEIYKRIEAERIEAARAETECAATGKVVQEAECATKGKEVREAKTADTIVSSVLNRPKPDSSPHSYKETQTC